MYEYSTGLGLVGPGWTDVSGNPPCSEIVGGGVTRCFENTEDAGACAREGGCVPSARGQTCSVEGVAGSTWCCPAHWPRPFLACPTQAGGRIEPSVATCQSHRVDRNSLTTYRAQAIWDIQSRLCAMGIDPGPIDGVGEATSFAAAIRASQARGGIPQTGTPDQTTLFRMGFSAADAQRIAGALAPTGPGGGFDLGIQLPWALVIGTSAAAVFMLYAAWKFKQRS